MKLGSGMLAPASALIRAMRACTGCVSSCGKATAATPANRV